MVNTGADGSFQLSAGSDQNFGPIELFPVVADTPRGEYEINCRILNPPTGELLSEDLNSFAIR